jgi:hypothetical protein
MVRSMSNEELIRPTELKQLTGSEPIDTSTVLDFWRWALGDLRMNNVRGYLVEFLVASAVGDPSSVRVEWGAYDAEGDDGTRIETKAAGRLQSWVTRRLSTPSWSFRSVRADRVWAEDIGRYIPVDPWNRVHVWVFALQNCDRSC